LLAAERIPLRFRLMTRMDKGFQVQSFKGEFLDFAIRQQVLLFGEFKTKAGRMSPYFFNAGLFNDGLSLKKLGEFYASAIAAPGWPSMACSARPTKAFPWPPRWPSPWRCRKGATCRSATTARKPRTTARAAHRRRAGWPAAVLIVDDVISAGTSVRESVELIRAAGADALRRGHRPGSHGTGPGRTFRRAGGQPGLWHSGDRHRQPGRSGRHLGQPDGRDTGGNGNPIFAADMAYKVRLIANLQHIDSMA
jgi:hypothetical protein